MSDVMIHPTALVEANVSFGPGCKIWDNVHIRHGAVLGKDCIVGEKSYIAYDVRIGNYVKLNGRKRARPAEDGSEVWNAPISVWDQASKLKQNAIGECQALFGKP